MKPKKKSIVDDIPKKMNIGGFMPTTETANETMMGRLAARMQSRDMIDELNLGNKGKSAKAREAQVADLSLPNNMAEQAKKNGNVFGKYPGI